MGRVADELVRARDTHGPASILHYKSGGSLGILKEVSTLLFARFGPVTTKRGDICSGAGEAAQDADFGIAESHSLDDLDNSRLIVVWGKNPHTSGVHLVPRLKAAKARGATVVTIDPVRTRMASLADIFLQVRPGADYAVAMAMIRSLFERDAVDPEASSYCDNVDAVRRLAFDKSVEAWAAAADVPAETLERVATLYASVKPACILVGWGLGRRRNGATTIRAMDALGALAGNLGRPGGGVSYYFGRRTAFDGEFGATIPDPPRTLAEARLGEEILAARDPAVRVAWVTAGNPVAALPDSLTVKAALESVFTVVVDTHPTDTTDVADVVLPTLTLLEDDDILGAYGNHFLRASRPAIAPPPGPRHELDIWRDLAERLGLGQLLAGEPRQWKRRATRRLAAAGVTLEAIERSPALNPFAKPVLFEDRTFFTPRKRARLLDAPAAPPPRPSETFPLTLLAISTPDAQSSQWSVERPSGAAEVRVHPEASQGIADGDSGLLVSAAGRLPVCVRHDTTLRRDVAQMAKGGQLRDGRCANVLVRAVETDLGGGAAYYDECVRLEPREAYAPSARGEQPS